MNGKKMTERALRIIEQVPLPAVGTRSQAMSAWAAYGADMQVAQGVARIVLRAVTSRPPHPIYGDDGVHELRSEEAVSALEWADQWLSRRIADNWSADGAHAELHKWNTR